MKIDKSIAEAIEQFLEQEVKVMKRDIEKGKAVLIAEHWGQDWTKYEDGQYASLNNISTFDLMQCLVNGYEVIEKEVLTTIHQVIEERKSSIVDEGTMGFHNYVTKYECSFETFVERITQKYNRPGIEVININYIGENKAVVSYKDK